MGIANRRRRAGWHYAGSFSPETGSRFFDHTFMRDAVELRMCEIALEGRGIGRFGSMFIRFPGPIEELEQAVQAAKALQETETVASVPSGKTVAMRQHADRARAAGKSVIVVPASTKGE